MDLILWRHAEAADDLDDLVRPLTGKGEQQAAAMAAWLRPRLPKDALIISSEARRARQTAAALTGDVRIAAAINPGADYGALLATAGWSGGRGTVVLVGHQPSLGETIAFLLAGEAQPWSVKKGALWWLSNRGRENRLQTVLKTVQIPELL